MVRLLLPASLLALATLVIATPVAIPPPAQLDQPDTPANDAHNSYLNPPVPIAAPPTPGHPSTPQDMKARARLSAEHFAFTPSSHYSNAELRRKLQRVIADESSSLFDHSPYGSGALPVPEGSGDTGFGGRTLF